MPDFCTMCGQEIYCETCGNPTDYGCFLEVEEPDVPMTDSADVETAGVSAARLSINDEYDYDDLDDLDEMDEEANAQPQQHTSKNAT